MIRPCIQIAQADPGGTAVFHQVLLNHVLTDTTVTTGAMSQGGWPIDVDPNSLTVQPGVSNTLTISVSVPMSPTRMMDMERTFATAISGTMTYTATGRLVTIVRRTAFSDLPAGHWADNPVQYLAAEGVISGYGDGTFRPNEAVTRAQFTKMLVTAMGWPAETSSKATFSDVPSDFWAYGYIETAASRGVLSGYGDGTFRPAGSVTRAQAAKAISIARGWSVEDAGMSSFTDVGSGDWFAGYVALVNSAEVMTGYGDGTFRPYAIVTRAQLAKVLTLGMYSQP